MCFDVIVAPGVLSPASAVPVDTLVLKVGARHIPNIFVLQLVERQLRLVVSPEAIWLIIVGKDTSNTKETLFDAPFDHELGEEGAHHVVCACAVAIRVQSIHAEEDVEWCELERIHLGGKGQLHVAQV